MQEPAQRKEKAAVGAKIHKMNMEIKKGRNESFSLVFYDNRLK